MSHITVMPKRLADARQAVKNAGDIIFDLEIELMNEEARREPNSEKISTLTSQLVKARRHLRNVESVLIGNEVMALVPPLTHEEVQQAAV